MSDNYDIPEPSKDPAVRARQQRTFIIVGGIVLVFLAIVGWLILSMGSMTGGF